MAPDTSRFVDDIRVSDVQHLVAMTFKLVDLALDILGTLATMILHLNESTV